MTQREFFNAVITANLSAEMTAFAQERINHLDTVNGNRKSKGTPTQRENVSIKNDILAGIEPNVTYTANEIGVKFGISTSKASALLRQLVQAGTLDESEVKIKGKGKVKGYTFTLATED